MPLACHLLFGLLQQMLVVWWHKSLSLVAPFVFCLLHARFLNGAWSALCLFCFLQPGSNGVVVFCCSCCCSFYPFFLCSLLKLCISSKYFFVEEMDSLEFDCWTVFHIFQFFFSFCNIFFSMLTCYCFLVPNIHTLAAKTSLKEQMFIIKFYTIWGQWLLCISDLLPVLEYLLLREVPQSQGGRAVVCCNLMLILYFVYFLIVIWFCSVFKWYAAIWC